MMFLTPYDFFLQTGTFFIIIVYVSSKTIINIGHSAKCRVMVNGKYLILWYTYKVLFIYK